MSIADSTWCYWVLLLISTQEASCRQRDGGQLTIVATQHKSNVVNENNTLNIVMNSTAFLDALGSRIQEIMKNSSNLGVPGRGLNGTALIDAVGSGIQDILKNPSTLAIPVGEQLEDVCHHGTTIQHCAPFSLFHYGKCQKKRFKVITSPALSWHDALVYCKEKKMNMATIRNQGDHEAMLSTLNELGMSTGQISKAIWIGGTVLHSSRGWFWISDGEPVTYTNWLRGQPDDFAFSQKCMSYLYGWLWDIRWAWDDNFCSSGLPFACEYC